MKKRFESSLRASSIEPETSIRQNITAFVVGTGTLTRLRKRRSIGSRKGMRSSRARRAWMRSSSSLRSASRSGLAGRVLTSSRSSSSSRNSPREIAPIARRRPIAPRIERTTDRLLGVPSLTNPARWLFHSGVSASWVCVMRGSARSSKKICMNSSLVRWKTKSSSPSPESLAWPLPLPWPPPPFGRSIWSPVTYSRLPGCTISREPPWP